MNRDALALLNALKADGWRYGYGASFIIDKGDYGARILHSRVVYLVRWTNNERSQGRGPLYVGPFSGRGWVAYTVRVVGAVVASNLPIEDASILLHAVGGSHRARLGWRNHYDAGGDNIERCASLAARGLMVRRAGTVYAVTDAGKVAIGIQLAAVPSGGR